MEEVSVAQASGSPKTPTPTVVFKMAYGRWGSAPVMQWNGESVLSIRYSDASDVLVQRHKIGELTILYEAIPLVKTAE